VEVNPELDIVVSGYRRARALELPYGAAARART
jgi:hypothetical protein